MKTDNHFYDLLIDQLSGKISEKDKALLNNWLKENPTRINRAEEIKRIYADQWQGNAASQEKWKKMALLINKRRWAERKKRTLPLTIAASIIILIGVATLIFNTPNPYLILTTEQNEYRKDTLANGSLVFLYPSSELTIDRQQQKPVALKGEAFFMMAPEKDNPVTINAKGLLVKVKGTSFRIKAPENNGNISVLVEDGTVEIAGEEKPKQSLLVYAGEEGRYSTSDKQLWKQSKSSQIYLIYQPLHQQ